MLVILLGGFNWLFIENPISISIHLKWTLASCKYSNFSAAQIERTKLNAFHVPDIFKIPSHKGTTA